MPSTAAWNLPYPVLSDPPNVPADIKALADRTDALITSSVQTVTTTGAVASPATGQVVFDLSTGRLKRWTGSAWVTAYGWVAYTPTWTTSGTNPSKGNGALTGEWCRIGDLVTVRVSLTFGSTTTSGTNAWGFSVPSGQTAAYTADHSPWPIWVGSAVMRDVSAFAYHAGVATVSSDGSTIGGSYESGQMAGNAPFTWASGDHLSLNVQYRAAA